MYLVIAKLEGHKSLTFQYPHEDTALAEAEKLLEQTSGEKKVVEAVIVAKVVKTYDNRDYSQINDDAEIVYDTDRGIDGVEAERFLRDKGYLGPYTFQQAADLKREIDEWGDDDV